MWVDCILISDDDDDDDDDYDDDDMLLGILKILLKIFMSYL